MNRRTFPSGALMTFVAISQLTGHFIAATPCVQVCSRADGLHDLTQDLIKGKNTWQPVVALGRGSRRIVHCLYFTLPGIRMIP